MANKFQEKATALMQRGRWKDAAALYSKILKKTPQDVTALYNRAVALHKMGRTEESESQLIQILRLARDFPEAYLSLASVQFELGRIDMARDNFQQALRLKSTLSIAHLRLGNIFEQTGHHVEALLHYQHSVQQRHGDFEPLLCLGRVLVAQNQAEEAYVLLRESLRLNPDHAPGWQMLCLCIDILPLNFSGYDDSLGNDIAQRLNKGGVDVAILARSAQRILRAETTMAALYVRKGKESHPPSTEILNHALLIAILKISFVTDLELESALTGLRALLLSAVLDKSHWSTTEDALLFACSLAQNCYLSEYLFDVSDKEDSLLEQLVQETYSQILTKEGCEPMAIAILACYRPLYCLHFASKLQKHSWPDQLQPLLRQQISEPLAETELKSVIETLSPVTDEVSRAVQYQYEENPYPRWSTRSFFLPYPQLQTA